MTKAFQTIDVVAVTAQGEQHKADRLALEQPLLLRYTHTDSRSHPSPLTTLLRTPGDDPALAAGFLFAEGTITSTDQIDDFHYCAKDDAITVIMNVPINPTTRLAVTHAGCGSCAMQTITQLYQKLAPVRPFKPHKELIQHISTQAEGCQPLFASTGGTHAALLFDDQGELLASAEDIGRHNALDKAIGRLWLSQQLDSARIAWISGRMGFELVQKSINAGISCLIAVGAPTSLAVEFARRYRLCAIGFSKTGCYNDYAP